MKIAGTRNSGAWYRFNNYLHSDGVDPTDVTALAAIIQAIDSLPAYLTALATIATDVGVSLPTELSSATAFASVLTSNGIPLNVWMGTLAFTTYTEGDSANAIKSKPEHLAEARAFAGDLRKACTKWKFAQREFIDLANKKTRAQGNPGGIADADKTT